MNFEPQSRPYDGAAHRACSDLRELYFVQSSLSRDGHVATLADARETYAREQSPQDPITDYADRRG